MKTIPSEFISSYLPIQELDAIEPLNRTDPVPLNPDDVFLVSQLHAYATGQINGVAVSRKISYKNLANKLSTDFKTSSISADIQRLSLSVDALSTTVYSESRCSMIDSSDSTVKLAAQVKLKDGEMSVEQWENISSVVAGRINCTGAINADTFTNAGRATTIDNQSSYEYTVVNDSYVNCNISAYEDGPNALEVTLMTQSSDGEEHTARYQTFMTELGANYYHIGIPLKTSTILKISHADSAKQFGSGSYIQISEHKFYNVPAAEDLNNYLRKPVPGIINTIDSPSVCKIQVNADGVLTNATSVYYGQATYDNLGLIRIGYNDNVDSSSTHKYAVKLDNDQKAYVEVPYATINTPGVMKFGMPDTTPMSVVRQVYQNENGTACVNVANQLGIGFYPQKWTYDVTLNLSNPLSASVFDTEYSLIDVFKPSITTSSAEYGEYVFSKRDDSVHGQFMVQVVYEGAQQDVNDDEIIERYADDPALQIVCNGAVFTTITPKNIQMPNGKRFVHAVCLGIFESTSQSCLFAAISNCNTINNGKDKIHFLIQTMNSQQ